MLSHSLSAEELRKFFSMIGCITMTSKKGNFNAELQQRIIALLMSFCILWISSGSDQVKQFFFARSLLVISHLIRQVPVVLSLYCSEVFRLFFAIFVVCAFVESASFFPFIAFRFSVFVKQSPHLRVLYSS